MGNRRKDARIELTTKHLEALSLDTSDRIINISCDGCKIMSTSIYKEDDFYDLKIHDLKITYNL